MIAPARYRYWTHPSAVQHGTIVRTPSSATHAAFARVPASPQRALSYCYDLNHFKAHYCPRSKSEEPRRGGVNLRDEATRVAQWMDLADTYAVHFAEGLTGEVILGSHGSAALPMLAEATVTYFSTQALPS